MRGEVARQSQHGAGRRRGRRPAAVAMALCGLLAAGVGVAGLVRADQTGRAAAPVGQRAAVAAAPAGRPAGRSAAPAGQVVPFAPVPPGRQVPVSEPTAGQVAAPARLVIPVLGVSTRLVRLGLSADGTLQAPASAAVAGWYTGSPRPGAIGAAVIGGHIDSYRGPGVFFRLRLLRPGDRVYVRRADGTVAVFRVTDVREYLKSRFPTESVYGPVPDSQLRLITCGGTFDAATGHYLSNVIAYAVLTR